LASPDSKERTVLDGILLVLTCFGGWLWVGRIYSYGQVKHLLFDDLAQILRYMGVDLMPEEIRELCEGLDVMTRNTNDGWAVILESSAFPKQTSERIDYLKLKFGYGTTSTNCKKGDDDV